MNPEHQLQLEEAQRKLSVFRKHLDLLARCTGESKNVEKSEVLSAVAELQSLVEWAAQQPELGTESAVLLMKLQELHHIRENLEKNPSEAHDDSVPDVKDEETRVTEKSESYSGDIEYISDVVEGNLCDKNGENIIDDDSISVDKDSLCDFSVSTEDPNLANAESPASIEEAIVDIIPSDDKAEDVNSYFKEYFPQITEDLNVANAESPAGSDESIFFTIPSNNKTEDVSSDLNYFQQITEDSNVTNTETPATIGSTNTDIIPSDGRTENALDYLHEVNQQGASLVDKELLSGILEYQETTPENKSEVSDSCTPRIKSPNLFRSEVVIIETDEDNQSAEWVNDPKNSSDPLDVCMYAIRNLYESLRLKENELLKLSETQSDQKHIEALQAVIIDFHKDVTNLNNELEKYKKENTSLKEQVLELEEAENDARLEAQNLEQKLIFLQEKDSHSQAELTQLKQNLKKCNELLAEKEVQMKELRSQIKYMETLIQKYEDQIKSSEVKEDTVSEQKVESISEPGLKNSSEIQVQRVTFEKGTQTYPLCLTKINESGESMKGNNNGITDNENITIDTFLDAPELEESTEKSIYQQETKDLVKTSYSIPTTSSSNDTMAASEQPDFTMTESTDNTSQKELLKRLHKLIDEDVSLQQQIHYVDEINLAMWKKLQNLDTHIGECKRQNINETNPVFDEPDQGISNTGKVRPENKPCKSSTDEDIPQENLSCLDQNEQYIKERLSKLEEINASFEKELKTRENICKEREKKYEEWVQTEKLITDDLKRISEERNWITNQVSYLKNEVDSRENLIIQHEQKLVALKEKNEKEISKIKVEQEKLTAPLNSKINEMIVTEKDILKMITNLKTEKNRSQGKSELERLKCNYIQLQLELSQTREEMHRIEEKFQAVLDHCASRHLEEENQLNSEIERLRNENSRCDKMIFNLLKNEKDLASTLEKQEKYLQEAREIYKKKIEETEKEHRSVETELECQLRQIEEGTAIATTVLAEERLKVEKELKDNIDDLKAKEEVYKARISELERDVMNLHVELHKMAEDTESTKQLQEAIPDEIAEKPVIASCTKADDLLGATENTPQSKIIDVNFNLSDKNILRKSSLTVKEEASEIAQAEGNTTLEVAAEDNVDELRAQVRELQSHFEKISGEVAQMPPVQTIKPITTSSLKMQKVEDIDYAEVDECCSEAWRKPMQNAPPPKYRASTFQELYGGLKSSIRYKDNVKNERAHSTSSVESVVENDYDEVLPRPTNFHVVQQVGSDTLLVGWNYVNPSVLEGFEVYLNNQVHERIYIPDRTKALISGLDLRRPIRLSIYALSRYGQMSEPAVLDISSPDDLNSDYYDEEDEYKDFEDPAKRKQRPYSMEW